MLIALQICNHSILDNYFQINTKRGVLTNNFRKKCIDLNDLLILSDNIPLHSKGHAFHFVRGVMLDCFSVFHQSNL